MQVKENSMNIYDEVIEQRIGIYRCYGSWNKSFQRDYEYERLILKALERAKKEHELLELYQKRFGFYNFDEDKSLREIKALEEELK